MSRRPRNSTLFPYTTLSRAAAILPLPPDEIARLVETGTLTDLPGVGASSGKVIAAAVRGEVPERLAALEAEHAGPRSEEHTSELQSRQYLVCRLLLEKNNTL